MAIIKKTTMKVEKWFVAGFSRDEKGRVVYESEIHLSQGYNTREMAEIECRKIRQVTDNHVMYVSTVRRSVKVEIEKRYEPNYDYDYKESKIYEAYAEYRRSEQW